MKFENKMPSIIKLLSTKNEAVSNFVLDSFENVLIEENISIARKYCKDKEYRAVYLVGETFNITTSINEDTKFIIVTDKYKTIENWNEILKNINEKFKDYLEKDIIMAE